MRGYVMSSPKDKDPGAANTEADGPNQAQPQSSTDEQLRKQALDSAAHLATIRCFDGVRANTSTALDIRNLFWQKSVAADLELARPKLEGRAISLAANAVIVVRKGFKPSEMAAQAVDFDDGNLSLSDVQNASCGFFGSDSIGTVYSTASSTPDAKRWRLLVPLAQPIKPELWLRILRGFALYLGKANVRVDATAERATQLHFLPNVPVSITDKAGREIITRNLITGEPLHFEHKFWGTELFDPQTLTDTATQALAELDALDQASEVLRQQQAAERERMRAERKTLRRQQPAAGGDWLAVVERFNLEHDTAELMLEYDYVENPDKPGHWRSPQQTTQSYATVVREDGSWFSLSGSDAAAGLGTKQGTGVGGDQFDLFRFYECGNDFNRAVATLANQAAVGGMLNGPLGKPHPHGLVPDGNGFYAATRTHVEVALRAPDFCLNVAFDEFLNETMVLDPGGGKWRKFTDHDVFNAAVCLERSRFRPIAKEIMRDAILAVANDTRIDSAKDWANGLKWDGVSRVDTFLTNAFGAEPSAYHTATSRYIWSALAGRVLQPGIKCDMVPIASGPQGARKSSVVKAMAPYTEAFCELDLAGDEADLYRLMSGRLVMEMPELSGMRKREVDNLKRFVVAQENVWVEKWRTTPTTYKRRCLLFGTTNEEGILADVTGNRRWLPFRAATVSMCDPDWVVANREQLWAEGVALFKAHGVLFEEAERLAKAVHSEFAEHDPWQDEIVRYLNSAGLDVKPIERGYTTTWDVLRGIGLSTSNINRASEMRVARVLKQLGYTRAKRRIDGVSRNVYVKAADDG
jgi:hypothetical protein